MRIWLNDFELNNPAKRVWLSEEDLEGFDLPSIRTSRGQRAGQSGSYFGAQVFDARFITIKGTIFSDSVAEALQRRREIQAALPLYPDRLTVRILDDDGFAYILYAQVIDFKMPISRARMRSRFKLELEAPDSTIYDDTAGNELTATIRKVIPGGYVMNGTSPVFGYSYYFSAGNPNTSVDNLGLITVLPVIEIIGKVTDPVITNLTTGQVFAMTGYSTSEDSVTIIDMLNRTVKLNGGNVFGYVTMTSEFWGLVPGTNEIKFESTGGSDVNTGTMKWRPGVRAI